MKKLLSVLMAVVMMFTLTACGGSSKDYNGTYTVSKFTYEGKTYQKGDDMWDMMMGAVGDKLPTIILKDDGKCTLTLEGGDDTSEAKYEVDGDKITFSADGEDEKMEATIKDGEITLEESGVSMTFSK